MRHSKEVQDALERVDEAIDGIEHSQDIDQALRSLEEFRVAYVALATGLLRTLSIGCGKERGDIEGAMEGSTVSTTEA